MPFKSAKQRRYMHANLPDIADRWEDEARVLARNRLKNKARMRKTAAGH